jgi:two-component system chemotaxis response regulator CheB
MARAFAPHEFLSERIAVTLNATSTPRVSADADLVKAMVVDDSAVIRGLLTRTLESTGAISVVASVGNGKSAIETLARTVVDVIVLDIEMPIMDGIEALPQLVAMAPSVKILMASTLTQRNAELSLKAMSLGAADYVPKPTSTREVSGQEEFRREICSKVIALGQAARANGSRARLQTATAERAGPTPGASARPVAARPAHSASAAGTAAPQAGAAAIVPAAPAHAMPAKAPNLVALRASGRLPVRALALGSSTGGPQALFKVIANLNDLRIPIFLTQHMPPAFTAILADHIARQCKVPCVEAKDGMAAVPGQVHLAPGDFHMLVRGDAHAPTIHLDKGPPENFCRPAVDPMLRSLVNVYGGGLLTCILTGMGSDGEKGSESVVNAGGTVVAQDEATSVVWGMPGAVSRRGLCSAVLPLDEIGPHLRKQIAGAR